MNERKCRLMMSELNDVSFVGHHHHQGRAMSGHESFVCAFVCVCVLRCQQLCGERTLVANKHRERERERFCARSAPDDDNWLRWHKQSAVSTAADYLSSIMKRLELCAHTQRPQAASRARRLFLKRVQVFVLFTATLAWQCLCVFVALAVCVCVCCNGRSARNERLLACLLTTFG